MSTLLAKRTFRVGGENHVVGERWPARVMAISRGPRNQLVAIVSAPIFPTGQCIACQWLETATEAPPDVGDDGMIVYRGWHNWKYTGLFL